MEGVHSRLNRGGLFVFDCWNGVAAIKDPPQEKITRVSYKDKRITSHLIPATDYLNQVTQLSYEIVVRNGKKVETGGLTFNQTLWTPRQIREALEKTGFEILLASPFMKPDLPAKDTDWKIMFVARKPV